MSKTVFFYSSVQTKKMFSIQSYYRNDILILKDLGYKVALSKKSFDFYCSGNMILHLYTSIDMG